MTPVNLINEKNNHRMIPQICKKTGLMSTLQKQALEIKALKPFNFYSVQALNPLEGFKL
jgi:hypothetical protein